MHKSILKIILILYIFLHICYVESEEVSDGIIFKVANGEYTGNIHTIDFKNEEKSSSDDTSKGGKSSTYELTKPTTVVDEPGKVETTIIETTTPDITQGKFEYVTEETKDPVKSEIQTPDITQGKFEYVTEETKDPEKSEKQTPNITTPIPTPTTPTTPTTPSNNPINKEVQPTPTPEKVNPPEKEDRDDKNENKIAPVTTKPAEEIYHENESLRIDNVEGPLGNVEIDNKNNGPFSKIGTVVIFVGTVSIGLVAVSGYQVYKRKNEKGLKQQKYINHNISHSSLSHTSLTPSDLSENNQRASIAQSLILEESQNQAFDLYYSAKSLEEKENPQKDIRIVNMDTLTYQSPKPRPQSQISIESATSKEASIDRSTLDRNSLGRNSTRSTISRNSIVRHSFLNPNIRIVRTGKRTQQLFEATNDHPAIIETFPSMERPYEPVVPVPLEESDTNSLHPHSIYQMYQDEMEFENYYAYTIDDKEYIIDPTTNRVLEIHDLTTDEYVLVEEELYLDFSGSDDSDSDKQTL